MHRNVYCMLFDLFSYHLDIDIVLVLRFQPSVLDYKYRHQHKRHFDNLLNLTKISTSRIMFIKTKPCYQLMFHNRFQYNHLNKYKHPLLDYIHLMTSIILLLDLGIIMHFYLPPLKQIVGGKVVVIGLTSVTRKTNIHIHTHVQIFIDYFLLEHGPGFK